MPSLQKVLDKDARAGRTLTGPWKWLVSLLCAGMVLFYFYTAGISSVPTQYHRGVYVIVTYVLVFLLYPVGPGWMRVVFSVLMGVVLACTVAAAIVFDTVAAFHAWLVDGGLLGVWPLALGAAVSGALIWLGDRWMVKRWPALPTLPDVLGALAAAGVVLYWILQFEALNYRAGAETQADALISLLGIVLSVEVCRRVLGWAMACIGLGMLLYGLLGPFFPELIQHRGFGVERLCTALFLKTDGVFGIMANVLATYVILFIFFGAFLQRSGAGRFFIDLPMAIAGRSTGGPAKVAVIASALFGSVSGSAIANTVSTGSFTIPLMKRAGFRPHVAGAIEPSASIGGMFMPPIMGAGGFLMAELTETPYPYIMLISVGPALLYFFSVFCMIHLEAKKQGIRPTVDPELPHWTVVLRRQWYYSLPLVIITVLMILGKSPGFAAFWATLSCIAVSWVKRETRMGVVAIWEAIQLGARNTLIIGATLGVIGIIVGTISLTGLGLKFSNIIISLAGGYLLPAVLLIGVASLVLGMGVPVTAAYLITAVLAVPPLTEMGVVLLAAHMIVYWFSQDSNITPPVCVAAYAGAAIAGADPWKTGWTSFKFAKLLYVMPLLFAFTPAILLEGSGIRVPELEGQPGGAFVQQVRVEPGDRVAQGSVVLVLLDGERELPVVAPQDAVIKKLTVTAGDRVRRGAVLAETRARWWWVLSSFVSALLGTMAFSALSMFYLARRTTILEWVLLAGATVLLFWPTVLTDLTGLLLVGVVLLCQRARGPCEGQGSRA